MLEEIQIQHLDKERIKAIIHEVGPCVEDIFHQLKSDLGGRLPQDLMFGIVAGFLRGKGYSWEKSFIGMHQFINVIKKLADTKDVADGELIIKGKNNGNVDIHLK